MAFYTPRNVSPADQILFDANGDPVGIQPAGSSQPPLMGLTPDERTAVQSMVSPDGITTWANRATVLAQGITTAFFTDLGIAGLQMIWNGARWRPAYGSEITLSQLLIPDTNLTSVVKVGHYAKIHAGLAAPGDEVMWTGKADLTGAADTVNLKMGFGGVAALTYGADLALSSASLNTINCSVTAEWGFRFSTNTSVRPITMSGSSRFSTNIATPAIVTGLTDISANDTWVQIAHWVAAAAGVATVNLTASRFVLRMGS